VLVCHKKSSNYTSLHLLVYGEQFVLCSLVADYMSYGHLFAVQQKLKLKSSLFKIIGIALFFVKKVWNIGKSTTS